jgi:Tol biopolymer transport system component
MLRRKFLMVAGAAAFSSLPRSRAQVSLGTLTWVEPDGLWIRELPDGSALKLASAKGLHSPRFSPTGRWIAFEDGADKRWLVRNDGKVAAALDADAAPLLSRADLRLLQSQGVFAPDGQRYVFSRDLGTDDGPPTIGQLCLASLATPDRQPEVLVFDQSGAKVPYSWTRDGKSVIYWNGEEWSASLWSDGVGLYSVDVESGRSRELGITALSHRDMLDLAPLSTGNKLVVSEGVGRETWAEKRVTVLDLDTGIPRRLTRDDVSSVCPAWSPDGRRIACSAAPDADVAYANAMAGQSYRVTLPNGHVETRTYTPETRLGIGGGEEAHAYLQQRKIWLLDPSATNPPQQLTQDPNYRDEEPMWSADGSHILFARMDYEGHSSLWLMGANGAGAVEVCRLQIPGPSGEQDSWFGYYGYIDWHASFDWRR